MHNAPMVKIIVFAPESHADMVRQAAGDAGAGKIGKYSHCSFSSKGRGRFLPTTGASPTIGRVGKSEVVDEERIEFVCKRVGMKKVLAAIRKVHPYEEVAIDIYSLMNVS